MCTHQRLQAALFIGSQGHRARKRNGHNPCPYWVEGLPQPHVSLPTILPIIYPQGTGTGFMKWTSSLLARGAGHVRYKGHPGAVMPLGMTTMAHNGAVVVRIRQQRLSKRAQKFRRLLGLRQRKINGINDPKN